VRIIHVFRSPVGGLFRHVRDLAQAQSADGHKVGIICDSTSGGVIAKGLLDETSQHCALGVTTFPIGRLPSPNDVRLLSSVRNAVRKIGADVLHGHGAKGGLHARMAGPPLGIPSVYTPHGGSLHYRWNNPVGALFLGTERYLAHRGSGCVFVCEFEKRLFSEKIGLAGRPSAVVHNGLWPEEFTPVTPAANAKDLLFVGEVRHMKGIDILLEAIHRLTPQRRLSLAIVGDGPEMENYRQLAAKLGLSDRVSFEGRKPIRDAFPLGKMMIVPSRNESFPYVVLEAIAARIPLIATSVGGIAEVLPAEFRIAKPDVTLLADKISEMLADIEKTRAKSGALAKDVQARFSVSNMARNVTRFYETLKV